MKVLNTLILIGTITALGACGVLKEKNEGALASTYSTLYAFFETAQAGSIGCYPSSSNNNNSSSTTTLRAVYSFQIERPSTLVVCVKITSPLSTDTNYAAMMNTLSGHEISFYASNTKVNPGDFDVISYPRIPILGTIQPVYVTGTGSACPFNADSEVKLVARFDMDSLTDYEYITAVDDSCGMSVGTGMSPFALAKQYGVTY